MTGWVGLTVPSRKSVITGSFARHAAEIVSVWYSLRNAHAWQHRSDHSDPAQPMTRQAVNYIVRVAGETAKLGRVWPHMLRHSCGYYLADQGTDLRTMQDYHSHRDPKHTAHYTRVAGHRFEGLEVAEVPSRLSLPPPEPDAQPTGARLAG